jgi:mannose-6-phosphate isomerase-like protein (cupin superfamily)
VVTVTDPTGATVQGVHVEVLGSSDRSGETDDSGTLRFTNVRTGAQRVRLSGPGWITFEKEVTVGASRVTDVDVTLNPAPEPLPIPDRAQAAPQPATPSVQTGPPGEFKLVSILDLLEKDFVGRQPRKETALGCSGNARATMIQLNESMPERLYENGESMYYVLGGEGSIRVNGRESAVLTGGFAMVPRGSSHTFVRKGRRPLILLGVLSGEPCQTQ